MTEAGIGKLTDELKARYTALRRRAMDYLARREHSRCELQRKLSEKFPDTDPNLLEDVLSQLEADGLLSEERFVESYIRGRISKGYGPMYIRHHLKQRGVSSSLVDACLCADDEFWLEQLCHVIEHKYGTDIPEPGTLQWARLQRFVLSRGYFSSHLQQFRRSLQF